MDASVLVAKRGYYVFRGISLSSKKGTRFPFKENDFQGIFTKTTGFPAKVFQIYKE